MAICRKASNRSGQAVEPYPGWPVLPALEPVDLRADVSDLHPQLRQIGPFGIPLRRLENQSRSLVERFGQVAKPLGACCGAPFIEGKRRHPAIMH